MKKTLNFLTLTFILLLVGSAGNAWAQLGIDIATSGPSIELTTSPSVPTGDSKVTAKIVSFSTDLSRADVSWEVNGKVVSRGVGNLSFEFMTGPIGSVTTLVVNVRTKEGLVVRETKVFVPGRVDLIWQANSWVPPFYKGKALGVSESDIEVYAIAYLFEGNGRIPPQNLVYDWYYNFEPMQAQSGLGKSSIKIKGPNLFAKKNLRVRVSSLNNRTVADKQITFGPTQPAVLVWQDDPLGGVDYDHPIGGEISFGEEIRLKAGGIYFPVSHAREPGLIYKWVLGGKKAVVDETTPDTLTLRRPEGGGESRISIGIQDPFDSLLSASKVFQAKSTNPLF